MYIILYKKRQRLGLLNPLANPFYPATDNRNIRSQEQNANKENTEKDNTTKTNMTAENSPWVTITKNKKNGHKFTKSVVKPLQHDKNRYKIFSEENDTDYDDNDTSTEYEPISDEEMSKTSTNSTSSNETNLSVSIDEDITKEILDYETVVTSKELSDDELNVSREQLLQNIRLKNKENRILIEQTQKFCQEAEMAKSKHQVLIEKIKALEDQIKHLTERNSISANQVMNEGSHQKSEKKNDESDHLNTLEANKNLIHAEAEDNINDEKYRNEKSLDEASKEEIVTEERSSLDKITINESIINGDTEEALDVESALDEELFEFEESMGSDKSLKSTDQCDGLEETSDMDFDFEEFSRLAASIVPYEDTKAEIEEVKNQLDRISRDIKLMGNDP